MDDDCSIPYRGVRGSCPDAWRPFSFPMLLESDRGAVLVAEDERHLLGVITAFYDTFSWFLTDKVMPPCRDAPVGRLSRILLPILFVKVH